MTGQPITTTACSASTMFDTECNDPRANLSTPRPPTAPETVKAFKVDSNQLENLLDGQPSIMKTTEFGDVDVEKNSIPDKKEQYTIRIIRGYNEATLKADKEGNIIGKVLYDKRIEECLPDNPNVCSYSYGPTLQSKILSEENEKALQELKLVGK